MTRTITTQALLFLLIGFCLSSCSDTDKKQRERDLIDAYERVNVVINANSVLVYNSKETSIELIRFYIKSDSGDVYQMDNDKMIVPGVSNLTFGKYKFKTTGNDTLLNNTKIVRAEAALAVTGLYSSFGPSTYIQLEWDY